MTAQVKPVPDNYPALSPYLIVRGLIVRDGAAAVGFYQRVFGGRQRLSMARPDGKLGQTELEIGSSLIACGRDAPASSA